jgi:iron complex transport system substrate-binding protein
MRYATVRAIVTIAAIAALVSLLPLPATAQRPARIISVIPAVTEMLFAVGAGPQVVAVGSFDRYPPEVAKLERVGALLDPDLERILALKPDLVVVYGSQTELQQQLERAGIPYYSYRHGGLPHVTRTIRDLGKTVGHAEQAERVADRIDERLRELQKKTAGRPTPATLVVMNREALALRAVYASGGTGFLNDMLTIAGGRNVFADISRESVQASSELIIARKPEVIVEVRVGEMADDQRARELDVWRRLTSVPAVRSNRVFLLTDERTVIPGPRVAEGAELIARALHPEAFK